MGGCNCKSKKAATVSIETAVSSPFGHRKGAFSFAHPVVVPVGKKTLEIPKLGLKLSFIQKLNEKINPEDLRKATTREICEKYVMPSTGEYQCSFCEYIECIDKSAVGPATVFVVHAWDCLYMEVIHTLFDYFKDEPDVIVWFDIFSYNQHLDHHRDLNWWNESLMSTIKDIGRTVLVLTSWNDAIPLSRTWCIWEIYCSVTQCDFKIAMSHDAKVKLVNQVDLDPKQAMIKAEDAFRFETLRCTNAEDMKMIVNVIGTSAGFDTVHAMVSAALMMYVHECYSSAAEQRKKALGPSHVSTVKSMVKLVQLNERICERIDGYISPESTQELLEELLFQLKVSFPGHPDLLNVGQKLAEHYETQKEIDKAEVLYSECVQQSKALFGFKEETLYSMSNLARLYQTTGKFQEAFDVFEEALEKGKSVLDKSLKMKLHFMNGLAINSNILNKNDNAISLFEEIIAIRTSLNPNDPILIDTMSNLATLYSDSDQEKALKLYRESLDKAKSIYGLHHPTVVSVLSGMASCYHKQGMFEKAESSFMECLQLSLTTVGTDHILTAQIMGKLAEVYKDSQRLEEAFPLYELSLTKTIDFVGRDHPSVLRQAQQLAEVSTTLGIHSQILDNVIGRKDKLLARESKSWTSTLLLIDQPPVVDDTGSFSTVGIKLSFIAELIKDFPEDELRKATTTDVCDKFIKPVTREYQSSFCELMTSIDPSKIGPATVFISHAWRYLFLEVLKALLEKYQNDLDVVIWFDLFCNNQHKAPNRDFLWWTGVFKTAIEKIGRTVMVFTPWNDPIPLTRGWCIWELYCTIETSSQFEIAMTSQSQQEFLLDIDKNPIGTVNNMLSIINCEKSECINKIDKVQIHEAIKKTIGFYPLNQRIFETMRKWVTDRYSLEYEKRQLALGKNEPLTLKAMHNLAMLFQLQGNFVKAEALLVECLEKQRLVLGADDHDTFQTMNHLAMLYNDIGKFSNALSLLEECLQNSVCSSKANSKGVCLQNLAISYQHMNMNEKAEMLLEECYGLFQPLFEASDPSMLRLISNMAALYQTLGKHKKAEELYTSCLELRKENSQSNHPHNLIMMANLASLYETYGKHAEAESLFFECYEKQKLLLGVDHPDTLSTMYKIASSYYDKGMMDRSVSLYEECLEIQRRTLGSEHPDTLATMQNLSVIYTHSQKDNQGLLLILECLDGRRKIYGVDHPQYVEALANLAAIKEHQGELEEAKEIFIQCLTQFQRFKEPKDKKLLTVMNNLGTVYQKLSEFDKAEELFLQCREHDETDLKVLHNLATLYKDKNDFSQAERLFIACLEKEKLALGTNHSDTLHCMNNLAQVYHAQGKYQDAEFFYQECLQCRRLSLGLDHRDTLISMYNLATVYKEQQKFEEAEPLLVECLERTVQSFGVGHQDTVLAIMGLVELYQTTNNETKVKALISKYFAKA
jgi:tetratricopeptide (TPR) repeat protein